MNVALVRHRPYWLMESTLHTVPAQVHADHRVQNILLVKHEVYIIQTNTYVRSGNICHNLEYLSITSAEHTSHGHIYRA